MSESRNPYNELGGEEAVRALVDRFYDAMNHLPQARGIRAMHAADLAPMRGALTDYLSGWLGGPPLYFDRPDSKCIHEAHAPFEIGKVERDAWVACMDEAMEAQQVDAELRGLLHDAFARIADALRNQPAVADA